MLSVLFDKAGDNPRLTWFMLDDTDTGEEEAFMSCSNGHVASFDDHDISEDGTVTPSVQCPVEGCDFHKYVRLQGWGKEE